MNSRESNTKEPLIFQCRQNDYVHIKENKSLLKQFNIFKKTDGPMFGGSSLGPHIKLHENWDSKSIYYLAKHNLNEYFAFEIFQRLTFNTPKARILTGENQKFIIASSAVKDYLPVKIFRPDTSFSNLPPTLRDFSEQYKLDYASQTISHTREKRKYKISGNLFTYDLIALLCNDSDLQPRGNNLGLVKMNNRFYAAAIDKEACTFTGSNYNRLAIMIGDDILDDPLFAAKTREQLFFMLYQVDSALKLDDNKQCDFDRIFLNTRVMNTPGLRDTCAIDCTKFKKSAHDFINHYQERYGKSCITQFTYRETLRQKLAYKILAELPVADEHKSKMIPLIIEDLRGPYYSPCFMKEFISDDDMNNQNLIDAVIADFCFEFNLTSTKDSQLSMNVDSEEDNLNSSFIGSYFS